MLLGFTKNTNLKNVITAINYEIFKNLSLGHYYSFSSFIYLSTIILTSMYKYRRQLHHEVSHVENNEILIQNSFYIRYMNVDTRYDGSVRNLQS